MGRKRKSGLLNVALNGRLVGQLVRAADGATRFDYAKAWLDWEYAIPVSLSIPLIDRPFSGAVVRAVFDNLLPDDERIRVRIASRVGAEGTDAFSLLAMLGRDCVGALQFLPDDSAPEPPKAPEGEALTIDQVADRIRSLATAPLGMRGGDDAFRISLAGAQDKTALLFHEGKWMLPTGTTPTTHILKPQIGRVPSFHGEVDMTTSVQNEHVCMSLCKAFGLDVADTEILVLDEQLLALSVKRFDRQIDRRGRLLRLPQEDLCQAQSVPPTLKYEVDGGPGIADCLGLLKSSDEPEKDRKAFMKAQLVFWLIGATDGHAKNFSIALKPQGRFSLTPLYDILSTQWQYDQRQIPRSAWRMAMSFGARRRYKLAEILPRHIEQTTTTADYPTNALHETMRDVLAAFPAADATLKKFTSSETIPIEMLEALESGMRSRAADIQACLNNS